MVWCDMVWYGLVRYGMAWHGMAWHGMVWYGMVYVMVRYGMVCYALLCCAMVWYGMVGYSMVWYGSVRYDEILLGAKKKNAHLHAFLRRSWLFSRALGCGARREPACTPRCNFGSREGSVARILSVQSRKIWQVIAAIISAELQPSKIMENPHVKCGGKTSLEGNNSSSICYVTSLVCFLTMASQTGCEIMNSEVAGSILTVFPLKGKKKGIF